MGPSCTNVQIRIYVVFFELTIEVHAIALTSLSDWCRLKSSMPSRSIESPRTNTNGAIALTGFNGEIEGIDYIIAINRKYMLAYRRN